MSHELRTPLNAIIGFTGTLLMKLPGPLLPDQERHLRTVQSSGRHLLSLINDLLDLAKIEFGKVEINLEAVECGRVVDEVAAALRPAAEAKGLEFLASVEAGDLTAQADRRALSQILLNLTSYLAKPIDPEIFVRQVEGFLPLERRAAAPRLPAVDSRPVLAAAPQRQTILAVDNLAINLELARSILEPSGYKVVAAFTMEEGLALARADSYDLILSDVCMSGGSGYDFLQEVKQDPRLRPVPFVLITSSMIDEKARIKGLALGATRFLCRPIEPELLLAEIRACLAERGDE